MSKKKLIPNYLIELLGIALAIIIIFSLWIYYPSFIQNMDTPQKNEPKKVIVYYNLDFLSGKSEIDRQFKEYAESSNQSTKIVVPFKLGLASEKSEINDQLKKDDEALKKSPKIVEHQQSDSEAKKSGVESEFQKIGEKYGTYGDSYGSLNTLFSGLAFAVLIISLFMQRQELRAQREELEAQRNEIQESNAIADAQRNIAEKQRLITEQQAELNKQQIHDAKVQNYYSQLFKFLDEKQRKINEMNDYLNHNSSSTRTHNIFDLFIRIMEQSFSPIETLRASKEENVEDLHKLLLDVLSSTDHTTYNLISTSEFFEFTCFILNFIQNHKNLGVLEESLKIFISYQSFNEMYCMFIFAMEDEELNNFIFEYALLRKLNTYYQDKTKYLQLFADILLGEDSYTPKPIEQVQISSR